MIWQSSKNYSKSLTLDTKSRQQCRTRDQEYYHCQSTKQYHFGSKRQRYKVLNMINILTLFDL